MKKLKKENNYKNEMQNSLTKISLFKRKNKNVQNSKHKTAKKDAKLLQKAKNKNKLRVIYKKPNETPEVKIIPDIYMLKKAVINKNLEILPYQNVYIVFNKQKDITKEPINVIFDMYNIKGDLLIVQIDPKEREFKSLSQEDIIWFTEDLINKSANQNEPIEIARVKNKNLDIINRKNTFWQKQKEMISNSIKNNYLKELTKFDTEEKDEENKNNNNDEEENRSKQRFEYSLINVLTNIELTLASMLEINKK